MRIQKEKANAKINLYLDVLSKREDGFHDVKTVMHSISLCDELTVIYRPSAVTNVRVSVRGNRFLPVDERNLALKAAKLYLECAKRCASIEIRLDKRIPVAAGLAGGSSDAAATLRAMNKLFGKTFSERALYNMASQLGSDVPYCLYGKTALCEGRGNLLTKLPDNLKLNIVVAVANEKVSTPLAYSKLDADFSDFDGTRVSEGEEKYAALLSSIERGKISGDVLYNVFEDSILPICPKAEGIKKRLCELGATSAVMSGSGPSVFGIFEDAESAQRACDALRLEKITAFAAKSV